MGKASDEPDLGLLKELAVISELKVGATVQGGLSYKSPRRDLDRLLPLLDEYQATHDNLPWPTSASRTTMPAASTTALRSRIY